MVSEMLHHMYCFRGSIQDPQPFRDHWSFLPVGKTVKRVDTSLYWEPDKADTKKKDNAKGPTVKATKFRDDDKAKQGKSTLSPRKTVVNVKPYDVTFEILENNEEDPLYYSSSSSLEIFGKELDREYRKHSVCRNKYSPYHLTLKIVPNDDKPVNIVPNDAKPFKIVPCDAKTSVLFPSSSTLENFGKELDREYFEYCMARKPVHARPQQLKTDEGAEHTKGSLAENEMARKPVHARPQLLKTDEGAERTKGSLAENELATVSAPTHPQQLKIDESAKHTKESSTENETPIKQGPQNSQGTFGGIHYEFIPFETSGLRNLKFLYSGEKPAFDEMPKKVHGTSKPVKVPDSKPAPLGPHRKKLERTAAPYMQDPKDSQFSERANTMKPKLSGQSKEVSDATRKIPTVSTGLFSERENTMKPKVSGQSKEVSDTTRKMPTVPPGFVFSGRETTMKSKVSGRSKEASDVIRKFPAVTPGPVVSYREDTVDPKISALMKKYTTRINPSGSSGFVVSGGEIIMKPRILGPSKEVSGTQREYLTGSVVTAHDNTFDPKVSELLKEMGHYYDTRKNPTGSTGFAQTPMKVADSHKNEEKKAMTGRDQAGRRSYMTSSAPTLGSFANPNTNNSVAKNVPPKVSSLTKALSLSKRKQTPMKVADSRKNEEKKATNGRDQAGRQSDMTSLAPTLGSFANPDNSVAKSVPPKVSSLTKASSLSKRKQTPMKVADSHKNEEKKATTGRDQAGRRSDMTSLAPTPGSFANPNPNNNVAKSVPPKVSSLTKASSLSKRKMTPMKVADSRKNKEKNATAGHDQARRRSDMTLLAPKVVTNPNKSVAKSVPSKVSSLPKALRLFKERDPDPNKHPIHDHQGLCLVGNSVTLHKKPDQEDTEEKDNAEGLVAKGSKSKDDCKAKKGKSKLPSRNKPVSKAYKLTREAAKVKKGTPAKIKKGIPAENELSVEARPGYKEMSEKVKGICRSIKEIDSKCTSFCGRENTRKPKESGLLKEASDAIKKTPTVSPGLVFHPERKSARSSPVPAKSPPPLTKSQLDWLRAMSGVPPPSSKGSHQDMEPSSLECFPPVPEAAKSPTPLTRSQTDLLNRLSGLKRAIEHSHLNVELSSLECFPPVPEAAKSPTPLTRSQTDLLNRLSGLKRAIELSHHDLELSSLECLNMLLSLTSENSHEDMEPASLKCFPPVPESAELPPPPSKSKIAKHKEFPAPKSTKLSRERTKLASWKRFHPVPEVPQLPPPISRSQMDMLMELSDPPRSTMLSHQRMEFAPSKVDPEPLHPLNVLLIKHRTAVTPSSQSGNVPAKSPKKSQPVKSSTTVWGAPERSPGGHKC